MHTMNRRTFLGAGTAATAGLAFGLGSHDTLAGSALAQTVPDTSALNDLRSRLNGTLMTPKESGYESASAATNGRYLDIRPVAVARCADELDVVNCIVWCNEHGVSPVPRNGGHSYAGFSSTTGLLMDLRRLNTFDVDYASGTATVGGAALNNDALIATENGPLFLPGGTCLGVGFGGLTLGGGIGYNAHWAGLTSDHLQSTRIVTADGSLLDVDASNHSDLFWACRGGTGGTFGMNTSFTFDLVEVPQTDIGYYRFEWRGADDAAATLSAFDAIIQTAPPALNAVAMAEATEVGAGGPREAINVMSRGQYIGPVEELRELVQPLLDAATPTKQTLEEKTFWGMQRIIASGEPEPHSWGDISRYVADPIPDSATAAMVDLLAECPSRSDDANGSIWSLAWVGGDVMNSIPRTATAYVHRNVTTLMRPTTVWPNNAPASVGDELNRSLTPLRRMRSKRAIKISRTGASTTGNNSTSPKTTSASLTSRPSTIQTTSSTTPRASSLVEVGDALIDGGPCGPDEHEVCSCVSLWHRSW